MNEGFEMDNNLSFAARGVLLFLLKRDCEIGYLPLDDFLLNESQKSSFPLTKKQIKNILMELLNNGYVISKDMKEFLFYPVKQQGDE